MNARLACVFQKIALTSLVLIDAGQTQGYAWPAAEPAQYNRQQWTAEDGLQVGQVTSLAQTEDGYLWIGGQDGLVLFDGQTFRRHRLSGQDSITHVLGLTTDKQGSLWIWMQGANVLRYHGLNSSNVSSEAGFPGAVITALGRGGSGTVLMSTLEQQIFESTPEGVSEIGNTDLPNTLMMAVTKTRDGHVWVGTRDNGLYYLAGGKLVALEKLPKPKKINILLPRADNGLWIGTDDGLFDWNGSHLVQVDGPATFRHEEILSLVEDRDHNVWVGTREGLYRLSDFARGGRPTISRFLKGQSITALFEDREGDLWISTPKTLQRWNPFVFRRYTLGDAATSAWGPVYVDEQGLAWAGSDGSGLFRISQGIIKRFAPDVFGSDIIYSIAGGHGELWIGRQNGGLTHLYPSAQGVRSETFSTSDGLPQNGVFSVYQAHDGSVWAGTLSAGLSHLDGGRWQTFSTADGLPSNTVFCIAEDAEKKLWIGTSGGLARLSEKQWRVWSSRNGLPSDEVTAILSDNDERGPLLWVGTATGMAVVRSGVLEHIQTNVDVLREPVWGIARDSAGFLWISTPDHLARINRKQLLKGEVDETSVRPFGRADGADQVGGVRRNRGLNSNAKGDVWVSTVGGLLAATESYLYQRPPATIVHIESATGDDGRPIANCSDIAGPQRRIVFSYSGLNFAALERVRFRYRLDGYDKDWSEATSTRQAVYTNLDPGRYRFRVAGSNGEGNWSGAEDAMDLVIDPATWQTWWFRLSCLLGAIVLACCAYVMRVRQIAVRANLLFDERLAERMRIAQDLHDTLLQSFHALMLRFQAVSNRLPHQPADAKSLLEVAIDRAADALTESRDEIQKLRSSQRGSSDLVEVLTRIGHDYASTSAGDTIMPNFRVVVEGTSREVNSMVRDDVYRIGCEAIGNAFRHARAQQIEVEIRYESRVLALRVRDDGMGIDPVLLAKGGRVGHWGLSGMRERSEKLGGRFTLWSEMLQGTEIEVAIPASLAYHVVRDDGRKGWANRAAHQ